MREFTKLQQMKKNSQYFLCLPGAIVRAKGWTKGDPIQTLIDKQGNIVLRKKE